MLFSRAASLLLGIVIAVKGQEAPQALSIPPSGVWLGNDGNWSTFSFQVGTPVQTFNGLVSILRTEFELPLRDGCQNFDLSDCASLRGADPNGNGWDPGASHTFGGSVNGSYNSSVYDSRAMFGYDTVQFANATLENQLIAGIANGDTFWLGSIGLGTTTMEVNGRRASPPLQVLKSNGVIPSLSFGYTAGAFYRNFERGEPGSLTLGGYNRALMSSTNQLTSSMSNGAFEIGVEFISGANTLSGNDGDILLSNYPLTMPIDSTVSDLWLPGEVCDRFEDAFGLVFDNRTQRYVFNDSIHDQLMEQSPTVTFNLTAGQNSTTITLPYRAFDLMAGNQIYTVPQRLFPLRRADSSSQYTLGRVFLQEAYLMANLETSSFTIAQSIFNSPMPGPEIVTITSSGQATSPTPAPSEESDSGLSGGAIAGIVIGVIAVLVIVGVVAFFVWRRRKNRPDVPELEGGQQVHEKPSRFGSFRSMTAFQKNRASRRRASADAAHELAGDTPQAAVGYHNQPAGPSSPTVMRKDTHELDAGHVRRDENTENRVEA